MSETLEHGIVAPTSNSNALWSPQGTKRIQGNFEYSNTFDAQKIPQHEFISHFVGFEMRKFFSGLDYYAYNELLQQFDSETLDKAFKAVFIEALTGTRPIGQVDAYDDVKALTYDACLKLCALLFPTSVNNETFGLFKMIEAAKEQYNDDSAKIPEFYYNENFDVKLVKNPF